MGVLRWRDRTSSRHSDVLPSRQSFSSDINVTVTQVCCWSRYTRIVDANSNGRGWLCVVCERTFTVSMTLGSGQPVEEGSAEPDVPGGEAESRDRSFYRGFSFHVYNLIRWKLDTITG